MKFPTILFFFSSKKKVFKLFVSNWYLQIIFQSFLRVIIDVSDKMLGRNCNQARWLSISRGAWKNHRKILTPLYETLIKRTYLRCYLRDLRQSVWNNWQKFHSTNVIWIGSFFVYAEAFCCRPLPHGWRPYLYCRVLYNIQYTYMHSYAN